MESKVYFYNEFMRYADIIANDVVNGHGVCVSLFTQGCNRHCHGCFNQETWNYNGGHKIEVSKLASTIVNLISKNGIQRNFSILGGEPLSPINRENINSIIKYVRFIYPTIEIWIWTGYTLNELQQIRQYDKDINEILLLENATLIDGPFIEVEKDLSLPHRGSRNQNIYQLPVAIDFE